MWLEQDEIASETERREKIENKKAKKHGGESAPSSAASTFDVDGSINEKPGQAGRSKLTDN